jgi:hypothetical protein
MAARTGKDNKECKEHKVAQVLFLIKEAGMNGITDIHRYGTEKSNEA